MQLKNFQTKAIAEVVEKVNKLRLNDTAVQSRLTLVAPCGTGKTVMLKDILDESFANSIVLVVTPGKGDLATQTAKSLAKRTDRNVLAVNETTDLRKVVPGDILVMNYEKGVSKHSANQKDGLGGQYKSRISRIGEMFNLWNMFAKAQSNKDDVVLVIDEAHYGANSSDGQSAIRKFFDSITEAYGRPPMRLELTATPLNYAPDTTHTKWVTVDRDDAVREGLVRTNVLLNAVVEEDFVARVAELDGDQELALMEEMYARYLSVKSKVPYNPLMLFSVSNKNKGGEEEQERVLAFLKSKSMTVENGQVAIHTTDEKFNQEREHLTKLNSPVAAMVFKTTVAVGWDCPRAQFMMLMRNVSDDNKVFTTQLLGRILRQPLAEAFGDDELDRSYLYAPVHRNFQIPEDVRNEVEQSTVDVFNANPKLMSKVAALNPQSKREQRTKQKAQRSNNGKVGKKVILADGLSDVKLLPVVDLSNIDMQVIEAVLNADVGAGESGKFDPNAEVSINERLARERVREMVKDRLTKAGVKAEVRIGNGVMTALSQWALAHGADKEKPFLTILSHTDHFSAAMDVLDGLSVKRDQGAYDNFTDGVWKDWLPSAQRVATSGALRHSYPTTVGKASLYGPTLRHRATTSETLFEDDWLDAMGSHLLVWARNIRQGGELREVFSYTYQRDNGAFTNTEPDYWVVCTDDDGVEKFVSFEVKGENFMDGSGDDSRHHKAEAATNYTTEFSKQNLFAVAVYKKGAEWMAVTGVTRAGKLVERPLKDWFAKVVGLTL